MRMVIAVQLMTRCKQQTHKQPYKPFTGDCSNMADDGSRLRLLTDTKSIRRCCTKIIRQGQQRDQSSSVDTKTSHASEALDADCLLESVSHITETPSQMAPAGGAHSSASCTTMPAYQSPLAGSVASLHSILTLCWGSRGRARLASKRSLHTLTGTL